jgi:hypothetical protein
MELVNQADLAYPVILGTDGQVMDGMQFDPRRRATRSGRSRFLKHIAPDRRDRAAVSVRVLKN